MWQSELCRRERGEEKREREKGRYEKKKGQELMVQSERLVTRTVMHVACVG